MKTRITLLMLSFVWTGYSSLGISYTWTGAADTVFTNTANWSPSTGYPGSNDTAVIVSQSMIPTLSADHDVLRLEMTSGTLDLNGHVFTVQLSASFSGGTTQGGKLDIRGTGVLFTGTTLNSLLEVNCDRIELSGGVFNDTCWFETTGMDDSPGQGSCVFNAPVSMIHTGSSGKVWRMAISAGDVFNDAVTLTNSGNGQLRISEADTTYFNGNIIFNNNGANSILFSYSGGVSILASGQTMNIGGLGYSANHLVLYQVKQLGTTVQDITLTGTASLVINGCEFNGNAVMSAPDLLVSQSTFNAEAELIKTGTRNNFWYGGNTFNQEVTINNQGGGTAGEMKLASNAPNTFNGDAYFESTGKPVTVAADSGAVFKGNVNNTNSAVIFAKGLVAFEGSNPQELNSTVNYDFKDLTLNKMAGSVTANTPVSVTGTLNLTSGNLVTDTVNLLTMTAGSQVINASNNSFVSGPVLKVGNTAFEFPVGKSGFKKAIAISAPAYSTDSYTAEYFNSGQALGEDLDITLGYVDNCNHWRITRISGTSNVTMKLVWNSSNCSVSDTGLIKIASWQSNRWKDFGHGVITGNYSNGSISSLSAVDSFGYFTYGYDSLILYKSDPSDYPRGQGFVNNIGQLFGTDSLQKPFIKYYGLASNSMLFLGDSIFSYSFQKTFTDSIHRDSIQNYHEITSIYDYLKTDSVMRCDLKFLGINDSLQIYASDTSQGYRNYFYGDSSWAHALTYQEIMYDDIYSGIDLMFYSNDEIRFAVDPATGNPDDISFYYHNADSVKLDTSSLMNIYCKYGSKQYSISASQYLNNTWNNIDIEFQSSDSVFSFNTGEYENNGIIIISLRIGTPVAPYYPVNRLKWSTYVDGDLGGEFYEGTYIDADNNVYAVGVSGSTWYPPAAAIQSQPGGAGDVIISKFDIDRRMVFSTFYGGSDYERGKEIVADSYGNIIFVGYTASQTSFPVCTSCNGYMAYGGGSYDGFVVKLSPSGQTKLMATYLGGSGTDQLYCVDISPSDDIIVGGGASASVSTSLNQNYFYQAHGGNNHMYGILAEFDDNNNLNWVTHLGGQCGGGTGSHIINLDVDNSTGDISYFGFSSCMGSTIASGSISASSNDFPICTPSGGYSVQNANGTGGNTYADAVVGLFKYHTLAWSTMFGSASSHEGIYGGDIKISPFNGDIIITDLTQNTTGFPDFPLKYLTGATNISAPTGSSNGYIAKFGNNFEQDWTTFFGGNGWDQPMSLAIADNGEFYIGGQSYSCTGFNWLGSTPQAYFDNTCNAGTSGYGDGFLLKFNSSCLLKYGTFFGGGRDDAIGDLSYRLFNDGTSELIAVGHTTSYHPVQANPNAFPLKNYTQSIVDYFDQTMNVWGMHPFISNLLNTYPIQRAANNEQFSLKSETNEVNIYPNPFFNNVIINSNVLEIDKIKIFDSIGKIVYFGKNYYTSNVNLNLGFLQNGQYVFEVVTNEMVSRKKLFLLK